MNWYLEVLKKYAVFSGRARRKEYWYFYLFNFVISAVLITVDLASGTYAATRSGGVLSTLFLLAVLIPALAVSVRRLHDTNRSGWWLFLAWVPLGVFVVLFFMCIASDKFANQYGPSPKDPLPIPP